MIVAFGSEYGLSRLPDAGTAGFSDVSEGWISSVDRLLSTGRLLSVGYLSDEF